MAKTPSYLIAADGLPARVSGAWARDKLYYVERYFTIFNKGMYKKWPRRFYVDLMAGPGRCITAERDEFDGSPLLAVRSEPAFERCIFVESAPTLLDALRIRSEEYLERASILPGDCNDVGTINSIRNALPNSALGIAFVDNLGLDVTFASLDALTNGRKIDLLITLQVSDLTRNADNALDGDQEQRFDDFFGAAEWRGVIQRCKTANRTPQEIATELTQFYIERLGSIGYPHTAELHVLMKNTKNAPLYRLVLAARHELAVQYFREISKIEHSGQRGLGF